MELDDLKTAWQILDRRLEQQATLSLHLFREGKLDKLRSSLRPLSRGQIAQLLFGVLMVVVGVSSWSRHRDVVHLLVAGLSLHVYGVITILFAGATLGMLSRIDYSAPVVAIQKQLAKLRRVYIINGACTGMPWWVLWVPCIMLITAGAGADIYANAPMFVWVNLAAGVAGMLATFGLHRWSRNPRRPRLARFVDDSITGSSLRRARDLIEEIARFEQE